MFTHQRASTSRQHQEHDDDTDDDENIREIHALAPPLPLPPPYRPSWPETTGTHRRSSSMSIASTESENFTSMSREFNALVLAGSSTGVNGTDHGDAASTTNNGGGGGSSNLERIGEEENNPLAIVPDNNPRFPSPGRPISVADHGGGVSVNRVKKEEVESKIAAWQNAKIAKINNRFKRDDAIINGWENEQVQKSSSWMKKVERKLEAKRARAMEKMQNDIAKARRKAEERRATAEAKRGTKTARVLEVASLMRAVGRAPTKRSFF